MVFTACPAVSVSQLPNCLPLATPAVKMCLSHPSSQLSSPLIPAVKLFFSFYHSCQNDFPHTPVVEILSILCQLSNTLLF